MSKTQIAVPYELLNALSLLAIVKESEWMLLVSLFCFVCVFNLIAN